MTESDFVVLKAGVLVDVRVATYVDETGIKAAKVFLASPSDGEIANAILNSVESAKDITIFDSEMLLEKEHIELMRTLKLK